MGLDPLALSSYHIRSRSTVHRFMEHIPVSNESEGKG